MVGGSVFSQVRCQFDRRVRTALGFKENNVLVHLRRSLLAIGIAVVIALAAASQPSAGYAQIIVTGFTPPAGNLCNDTLTVNLTVDVAAVDLRGFTFVLEFDPTHVVPISVQRGSLMTGAACSSFFTWINSASVGDSIAIDGATLGCSMAGPGNIVRMRFVHSATQGASVLRCRSGSLRNALNQSLPFNCPDGTLTYFCPVPAGQPSWGHIKRLFR